MYKFYFGKKEVVCVSHFAGREYKGRAKCSPLDTFDIEYGKCLAQARCDVKIARARIKHHAKILSELEEQFTRLNDEIFKRENSLDEAYETFEETLDVLSETLDEKYKS